MCRILYRLLVSLARLAVRSGRSKDLEIIVLRHQLTVLHRQNNRPALADEDRALLGAIAARHGQQAEQNSRYAQAHRSPVPYPRGCPEPCRGWSGGFPVFVDESAAASATHRQPCRQREEPVKDATHEVPGWSAKLLVSAHDRIVGTHTHNDARNTLNTKPANPRAQN